MPRCRPKCTNLPTTIPGLISRFIVNETSSFRSSIQWVHDYAKVLKRGFNGIKKEAREKLAALDPMSAKDDREKRPFLEAVIIVCDAIVLWAKRHAVLARELAEKEQDPIRKAELLRMADNAERVPGEPARDFWEACQSQWFTQMFSRIEQKTGTTISNGRMDQYLCLITNRTGRPVRSTTSRPWSCWNACGWAWPSLSTCIFPPPAELSMKGMPIGKP